MKNLSLILNSILLVAVAVLFYLHFSEPKKSAVGGVKTVARNDTASGNFRIAYFEFDSIDNSLLMMKDIKNQLSKEEDRISGEMTRLQNNYNERVRQFQNEGANMSQVQSEAAQRELMSLQQKAAEKKQAMDQEYQNLWVRKRQEVKTKVEEFLKEYNKTKGYSYIFANVPELIYFRDSVYDVTSDVISGLNAQYSASKK